MARLTYPTGEALAHSLSKPGAPSSVRPDAYSMAADVNGDLVLDIIDAGHSVRLTRRSDGQRWTVHVSGPGAPGQPVGLPERIVARANRLMSREGITLHRDWRTKTHGLRTGPRRVLALAMDETVSAVLTSNGWVPAPGAAGTILNPRTGASAAPVPAPSAASPSPAPVAPAEQAEQGEPEPEPEPEDQPAPSAQAVAQGIPAAYAGKIVLSKQSRSKWLAARAAQKAGDPMVVAMVGPSGAGKTHAVHALAAEEGLDVVKFDASGVIEPSDWFGTVTLDGQGTRFVPSDLLTAITMPGARVLLLDEMNRANMRALNALLPLLDGSGTITVPQSGKRERVNRAVQVVLTANIGSQFLATEPLDEAVRTRVSVWIEVDHLAEKAESKLLKDRVPGVEDHHAATLAALGARLRASAKNGQHAPVSTRQLLAAARLMRGGLDPAAAVEAAITDGYSAEGDSQSERAKVKTHVSGLTWTAPDPKTADVFSAPEQSLCRCGHTPVEHGIGVIGADRTYCRVCGTLCGAYDPVLTAGG